MTEHLLNNLKEIPNLFMLGADLGEKLQNISDIDTQLKENTFSHKAIVFEGVSMGLASQCLLQKNIEKWLEFYHAYQDLYFKHLQIGLGWACAKHDKIISENCPLKEILVWKTMADGMGYYFALFKFKKTVMLQMLPNNLNDALLLEGFDSGVGRRLWYHYRGDGSQILNTINQFPTGRQANLWKGVGVACAYVGGFNKNAIEEICVFNQKTRKHFLKGLTLGALGKIKALEMKLEEFKIIKQLHKKHFL